MKKIFLVVMMVSVFMLAASPALAFTDVDVTHPHYDAIDTLSAWGVIDGYTDGTFRPGDSVKRAQFAKMAAGMFSLDVTEGMTSPFVDLGTNSPNSLYPHEYVAVAYKHGITKGQTTTTFNPYAPITRAQVITMAVRAMHNLYPGTLSGADSGDDGPWGNFSPIHAPASRVAEANGLLRNLDYYGTRTDPWGAMPRAEVAQLLYNLRGHLPNRQMYTAFGNTHDMYGVWTITVGQPEVLPPSSIIIEPDAGNKYLGVYVTARNNFSQELDIHAKDFYMLDPRGVKHEDVTIWVKDDLGYNFDVAPGTSVSGYVAFEVSSDIEMDMFVYDWFSYTDFFWE